MYACNAQASARVDVPTAPMTLKYTIEHADDESGICKAGFASDHQRNRHAISALRRKSHPFSTCSGSRQEGQKYVFLATIVTGWSLFLLFAKVFFRIFPDFDDTASCVIWSSSEIVFCPCSVFSVQRWYCSDFCPISDDRRGRRQQHCRRRSGTA